MDKINEGPAPADSGEPTAAIPTTVKIPLPIIAPTPKIIKSVNKLITNIIREQQDLQFFTISFFGGEPLMYFNTVAKPIIKHLEQEIASSKVKVHIHFTTNGYLLNSRLINYLKGKSISFQITLDGAKEDHDKTRFTKNGIVKCS